MLSNGKRVSGGILRGIRPDLEGGVSDVVAHIKHGDLNLLRSGEYGIVLGSEMAIALGVATGDSVARNDP